MLDRTPFYGESGGQIGDTGTIQGKGFTFRVEDTQRENDFTLHIGRVTEGTVTLDADARAEVDLDRRQAIRRAHSATHVLHHALHLHLGKHAQQAGSKVEPDRLRFDFANPEAVGKERLRLVEETVNDRILEGDPVSWTTMPIAEARKLGAMALFGEKYPEIVRVVAMGAFSRELCGGTHLDNVSQVGLFKIISEESVSAGTRRITALTGKAAIDYVRQEEHELTEAAAALRVAPGLVSERVTALLDEVKTLKKEASRRKTESTPQVSPEELLQGGVTVLGVTIVVQHLENSTMDDLRQRIDVVRRKHPTSLAVMLITSADGKVQLAAGLTPDLVERGLPRRQLAEGSRPDRRRRGRRPARHGPGRRKRSLEDQRGPGKGRQRDAAKRGRLTGSAPTQTPEGLSWRPSTSRTPRPQPTATSSTRRGSRGWKTASGWTRRRSTSGTRSYRRTSRPS